MKILVTGGSGFIGTNLVADLLKEGHDVTIFDQSASKVYPDLSIIANICDREKLNEALRGMDAVYHLAAEHRDDVRPVSLYYDVNVKGTENLVYAAKNNNVEKIIFTSSVAIYGLNAGKPSEVSPINPFNEYSKSKYQAEKVLNEWREGNNSTCLVIVRPVVIFGEKNRGNVFELLKQIAFGFFVMVGNGKNKKSMGYVLNLSRFLVNLLDFGPGIHVYNYADKPDLQVQDLVDIVYDTLKKKPAVKWKIPYPIGLMAGYIFDALARVTGRTFPISSIRIKKFAADTTVSAKKLKETGYVAPYSLSEGLSRMITSEFPDRKKTYGRY